MSIVDVHAFHKMNLGDAQQAADDLASELATKFDVDYGWDGDVIHFERSGVAGTITVGESEIHVVARLGLLLMMLQGRIEEEIREYLQTHFGCTFED